MRDVVHEHYEELSLRWWGIATDWQGVWDIRDVELELELQRVAESISSVFYNMARDYAMRDMLLVKLSAKYAELENRWHTLPPIE